jgi:hypothetical protein
MGLALVVCDTVIEDRNTGKKSLIGLFDRLHAANYPCMHPAMSVLVALTGAGGELACELSCLPVEGGQPAFAAKGRVNFQDPGRVVELVFNFSGVRFVRPGRYDLRFMVDDMLVMTRPLWVVPPPARGTA